MRLQSPWKFQNYEIVFHPRNSHAMCLREDFFLYLCLGNCSDHVSFITSSVHRWKSLFLERSKPRNEKKYCETAKKIPWKINLIFFERQEEVWRQNLLTTTTNFLLSHFAANDIKFSCWEKTKKSSQNVQESSRHDRIQRIPKQKGQVLAVIHQILEGWVELNFF